MNRQDKLTIMVTFGTGLLVGAYLFLVGFMPQIQTVSKTLGLDEASVSAKLTIEGERYGGCQANLACDSFQVRGDGVYSYLAREVAGGGQPLTGTLPSDLMQDLKRAISEKVLATASTKVEASNCNSDIDLSDYEYEVTFKDQIYQLDTCGTNFSHENSALGSALDKLWIYFRNS